jgi:hypothetical protein
MSTQFFWDDLLEYVEDRSVIPILGPHLLPLRHSAGEKLFLRFASERLAERLSIPVGDIPDSSLWAASQVALDALAIVYPAYPPLRS